MDMDYLKNFTKRMQKIGAYALLFSNSITKGTWKKYYFPEYYEQTNLIFAVMLYIMEQSLKEEVCTMDDIGAYIDRLNMQWFHKPLSYGECRELGDFIINIILCDGGKAMYFKGFDFELGDYEEIHVSFVQNRIVYIDGDIKRTSYHLTDQGYQLLLSTLEIEGNMMLTIQEMIFKLHLEKASYAQAVDDIKNLFNRIRIQLQKIREAMYKIRQNALLYSVNDYKVILEDNLGMIEDTKKKFLNYRDHVQKRVSELEEKNINVKKLGEDEEQNLKNLRIIESYLNRSIDEHQKILSAHFDLKFLYTKELEDISQMSMIKRFQFRSELYDKIIGDVRNLERVNHFLMPLFGQELYKTYNINKAIEYQKPVKESPEEEGEILEVEDENWKDEVQKRWNIKYLQYKGSMEIIFRYAFDYGEINLSDLKQRITDNEREQLIPSIEIFKEIIIEMLKFKEIDIPRLKQEQKEYVADNIMTFQLSICSLDIIESHEEFREIKTVLIQRRLNKNKVVFENLNSELGTVRRIQCSDISFSIHRRG